MCSLYIVMYVRIRRRGEIPRGSRHGSLIEASEFSVANLAFLSVAIAQSVSTVTGICRSLSAPHSRGDGSW